MKDKKKLSVEEKFGPPYCELKLKIPSDYNHETRLDSFRYNFRKKLLSSTEFIEIEKDITDFNFNKVTNKLIPGKTYTIKLLPVLYLYHGYLTKKECIDYLISKNVLLVGAHGLTLLYEYFYELCPEQRRVISFDEKKLLWVDNRGNSKFTFLEKRPDNSYLANCSLRTDIYYDCDSIRLIELIPGDCILCFSED